MTVYVDRARNPYGRMRMCHMLADSAPELMEMAAKIGVKERWFQNHGTPHYDICQTKRALAIQYGAVEVSRRELVAVIRRLRAEEAAKPEPVYLDMPAFLRRGTD